MSDGLLDKWRKYRDLKARKKSLSEAIASRNPETVKTTISNLRKNELSGDEPGEFLKSAIDEQNLQSFREVLGFIGNPKTEIKVEVYEGRYSRTDTYSPLSYAIQSARTHDIALVLATDERTSPSTELLTAAKEGGMMDVAAVLAKRVAELRRVQAAQLDEEAAALPGAGNATPAAPVPAEPAPAPAADGDSWTLMPGNSVAHVVSSPALGRKLTNIFNFDDRERVIITENLATGKERVGLAEKFDALSPEAVKHAEEKLKALTAETPKRSFSL